MCKVKVLESKMCFKELTAYLKKNQKYKLACMNCIMKNDIRTTGKNNVQEIWYNGSLENNPDSGRGLSLYLENNDFRMEVTSHLIQKLVVLVRRPWKERAIRWFWNL